MVSDVDLRDWDHINIDLAKQALIAINDQPERNFDVDSLVAYIFLEEFVKQVELIREKALKQPQIPALFKP